MIETARLADEIVAWLRAYAERARARGYVLGLSGGIDSAVVAGLCRRAMGSQVLAAILPCHSLPEDAAFAREVADAFHLETITIDLEPAYDAFVASLPPGLTPLALANVKPRLRMTTVYALAQGRGYLVAGTGNKSEIMVGYFTKWGDGGADVEPLGALYKSQVRALARELGVPQPIVDRAPTAGLWQGQTDEDEMGITYDEIEAVLRAIEADKTECVLPDLLHRVQGMVVASAHKRAMPPVFQPNEESAA
ncbi:MAG TPA: NAD+ synthase [Anaerolineae bacterium]|nr:NAD+ synthase [Anaerolineae bacterium]